MPDLEPCTCSHPGRSHVEGSLDCRLCDCTGFRVAPVSTPEGARRWTHKRCTLCQEVKSIEEFYLRTRTNPEGTVNPRCRDCDNTRDRGPEKLLRNRARHRATAELVARHLEEFNTLLAIASDEVHEEAARLAAQSEGQASPRLKPGRRRKGQKPVDRLDVARCPQCAKYHDSGHRCANCGAEPHQHEETG